MSAKSQTHPEPDEALKAFEELVDNVIEKASEADTRAKLIDPMFKDVLGWKEDDITRETSVHPGFTDYIFRINGIPKLIIEAKNAGKSFVVPLSLSRRRYKIQGAITTDNRIKEAIEQVQRYCIDYGVNFAVISNGKQYLVFEAFKRGQAWKEGECVVFASTDDIKKHFVEFWNVFSKNAVRNGSLRKYVSQEGTPEEFIIPREGLHQKDAILPRNDLSPFLGPFIDHVFGDLTDASQLDVLKSCYVARRDYQDADKQIGRLFDKPPDFAKNYNVIPLLESPETGNFERAYENAAQFLRNTAESGSVILLMGGIGSGKTTFIHHFFKFVIEPQRPRALWFYADFTKAPAKPEHIEEYVFRCILQDLEGRYAQVLQDLKEELSNRGVPSLKTDIKDLVILFSLLAQKGFTSALVLDNVDQQSYVSKDYQEFALITAKNFAEYFRTVTIITLREESFFRSTASGVLDAFVAPMFHISFPSFEQLIRSRIDYVLGLLQLSDADASTKMRKSVTIAENRERLTRYFEIIKDSIRHQRKVGRDILKFMNEVSGGNMRVALHFLRTFLISGNTNVAEMMSIDELMVQTNGPRYQIPLHHFIKSIILEDSRLYSSSHSRIMNVFELDPSYSNSHFLHLRLLNFLSNRQGYSTNLGPGFVEIDDLIRKGEGIGLSREAIGYSLKKLAYYGLVEFENQSREGFDSAGYVRLTNCGSYYFNELDSKFAYLDIVWKDTPIADPVIVSELLRLVVETRVYKSPTDLDERFVRTAFFLGYLEDREDKEFENNAELSDSPLTNKKFMHKIRQSFEEQKQYIVSQRRPGPREVEPVFDEPSE